VPDYDLVVVGAGPAGEKAAVQAAWFGRRVAVVEREALPGGALASGVVASKTLREAAVYLTGFHRKEVYGVAPVPRPRDAMAAVRQRSSDVVRMVAERARTNLERHGVQLLTGTGRLLGPGRVSVDGPGGSTEITTEVVVLATGSHPFRPPELPFDGKTVMDADEASRLDGPLDRVVVLGGGAVGCELATILTALGSDVTLVDTGPRLLAYLDAELSQRLEDCMRQEGMQVVRVRRDELRVSREAGAVTVELPGRTLEVDAVVTAVGRVGSTEGLGLDEAGVATDPRGRVLVDERFRTNVPGVYAVGDLVGPPSLASVGMEQARVAVCHAFDLGYKTAVDTQLTLGVYTIPEIASVGPTEEDLQASGTAYEVGRATFAGNVRATIAGSSDGLLKLLFAPEDGRLLAVHVLGDGANELVHQGQAVLRLGGSLSYFVDACYNVPTVSEAYKYAAYDGMARLAHRPTITPFA
jgi:NAD(P) transhydrogenase